MAVSEKILAAQQAYAARPYLVIWQDSHCSVPDRFDSFDDAFAFIQLNWKRVRERVARERYNASNLRWSYIEGPDGVKMPLCYLLLCDDVSSY